MRLMTAATTTQPRHLEMPIPGYACKANYRTNLRGTVKVGEVTCRVCLQVQIDKFQGQEREGFGGPKTRKAIADLRRVLSLNV